MKYVRNISFVTCRILSLLHIWYGLLSAPWIGYHLIEQQGTQQFIPLSRFVFHLFVAFLLWTYAETISGWVQYFQKTEKYDNRSAGGKGRSKGYEEFLNFVLLITSMFLISYFLDTLSIRIPRYVFYYSDNPVLPEVTRKRWANLLAPGCYCVFGLLLFFFSSRISRWIPKVKSSTRTNK